MPEPVPSISLAVVGAQFPNADGSNRRFEILLCKPGEPVELHPEPRNKFDPHAIAVLSCRGVQLGYLSAERAPRIGALLGEREVQAVFQRAAEFGAWIRVAFDGEVPVMTEAMLVQVEELDPASMANVGFYSDEVWPDD
jgi:hypothetical protein